MHTTYMLVLEYTMWAAYTGYDIWAVVVANVPTPFSAAGLTLIMVPSNINITWARATFKCVFR